MTEKLNTQVIIPAWAITLFFTLLLAFMIFSRSSAKDQQNTDTRVTVMEKEMEKKANQSDVDRIYVVLDRIDVKLDRLIQE